MKSLPYKSAIVETGTFSVGCNYWASHAGTAMWSDWRPDVVEEDLKQLSQEGLSYLRVFPLWPAFQPLTQIYSGRGRPEDLRFGEQSLPSTDAGAAGVSSEAMEKFGFLADIAEEHNLKLVVGLITGWMSGRLFVPPAFERLNVLADPMVRRWQLRFVRYFVSSMKDKNAIDCWDLGNECNCMADIDSSDRAYEWTAAIAGAIRQEDQARPIVSGMHGLLPESENGWRIQDQGELTDILTTHPYPIFTPYCNQDPIDTLRNGLHAVAESRMYSDIGGKPCFAEELGTLGPQVCSEATAARYLNMALLSLWAHDCRALFWWCAYDQDLLRNSPYDKSAFERELGLIRSNREPKATIQVLGGFANRLKEWGIDILPPFRTQAVCVLTEGQDQWAAAYSCFILAKQAGFDLEFQYCDQQLKDAGLYIIPSICDAHSFSIDFYTKLMKRVREGASAYFSYDNCFLSHFEENFGLRVKYRYTASDPINFDFADSRLSVKAKVRIDLEPRGAEILSSEPEGNPVFTRFDLGKGTAFFLSVPLERYLSETPGVFSSDSAIPFNNIYKTAARDVLQQRVAAVEDPMIGLTEHFVNDREVLIVAINYTPDQKSGKLSLTEGWILDKSYADVLGNCISVDRQYKIAPNDGIVCRLLLKEK
ncbi:MAG: beta-mannanase [Spirochaetales bacterium]|jgi:hypothetical protein|nr:beta-mannanase [Spirochaetales bacterium]